LLVLASLSIEVLADAASQFTVARNTRADRGFDRDEHGVTVRAMGRENRAEVWNDGVIRITHRPLGALPSLGSLVVIAHPENVAWKFDETPNAVFITTSRTKVRIEKATGCVSFLDLSSRPILEERESGTWLSATTAGRAPRIRIEP